LLLIKDSTANRDEFFNKKNEMNLEQITGTISITVLSQDKGQ
jgi:hypothetical protein